MSVEQGCECPKCRELGFGLGHKSDCAVHNEPAMPQGPCDCGMEDLADKMATQEENDLRSM